LSGIQSGIFNELNSTHSMSIATRSDHALKYKRRLIVRSSSADGTFSIIRYGALIALPPEASVDQRKDDPRYNNDRADSG
jgi:hypothetical protein